MRSLQQIRHWTPRYIFNRARCALRARLHPEYPWLAWPMIADLEGRLSRNDVGFEWGSGRSTLWFASRMGKLTSVEHHEDWFTQVENAVRQRGLTDSAKVMIRQLGQDGDFSPYVEAIDGVDDGTLTFCLVDGRQRGACALRALPKLAAGGIIVIDDAHRYLPPPKVSHTPGAMSPEALPEEPDWLAFMAETKDWECVWHSDGVHDTAYWVKPS